MRYVMMATIPAALNYRGNQPSQRARQPGSGFPQRDIRFSAGGDVQDSQGRSARTHYQINTVEKPELLERGAQTRAAQGFLRDLAQNAGPLPEEMKVEVTVPEAKWLKELENSLDRMNRVVEAKGLISSAKHATFRFLSGVQGSLYPVRYYRDDREPDRKMHLHLNFSGVSSEDLVKFASFLQRYVRT